MGPKISKLGKGVDLKLMNNFLNWSNFKFPWDLMLQNLEPIPIQIFHEF
jgi:hypothetical protein